MLLLCCCYERPGARCGGHIWSKLTANSIWIFFLDMSDARETEIFQKRFPDAVSR